MIRFTIEDSNDLRQEAEAIRDLMSAAEPGPEPEPEPECFHPDGCQGCDFEEPQFQSVFDTLVGELRSPSECLIDMELERARALHGNHLNFSTSAKVLRQQYEDLRNAIESYGSLNDVIDAAIRVGAMARRFLEDTCDVPRSF